MRACFKTRTHIRLRNPPPVPGPAAGATKEGQTVMVVGGYLSDLTDDTVTDNESSGDDNEELQRASAHTSAPSFKRQKLTIPARTQHLIANEERQKALICALHDIEKLIASNGTSLSMVPPGYRLIVLV